VIRLGLCFAQRARNHGCHDCGHRG
jgi:hypothetical protein